MREVTTQSPAKSYLGDGLYAAFDGFHIILTAENGIEISNQVYLEDQVFESLLLFAEKVWNVKITVSSQKTSS